MKLSWYDGGRRPAAELFDGEEFSKGGALLIGEKGKLYIPSDYGGEHVLLPRAKFKELIDPPITLRRSPGHHRDFLEACRDPFRKACSDFSYSGPLSELVLLGVLAMRTGKPIDWDPVNMKAINCPEADAIIKPQFRSGWSL